MQDTLFKFHHNLFQTSNFVFIYSSSQSFKFIQLRPQSQLHLTFFTKKTLENIFNH